jgi:hypothetical protein
MEDRHSLGSLEPTIAALRDADAIRILDAVSKSLPRADEKKPAWSTELAGALEREFNGAPAVAASEGEVAREALRVLALDPSYQEPIAALASGPAPERFVEPVTGTAVVVLALMALQTHVKIKRDDKGQWSFLVEKPSASPELLKSLAGQLLGLMGHVTHTSHPHPLSHSGQPALSGDEGSAAERSG